MLSDENQEKLAETIFMVGFEVSLKTLRERGIKPDAIITGMIRSMTTIVRMVFTDLEDN